MAPSVESLRRFQTKTASLTPLTLPLLNFAAGSTAGFSTDVIFYGLDSYKTQRQQTNAGKMGAVDVRRLFRGMIPLTVMGTVPSFGIFFAVYEPLKKWCAESAGLGGAASVCVAAFFGDAPASLAAVPSDVVKKRIVLGHASDPHAALRQVLYPSPAGAMQLRGLFTGWQANMAKDVPFAVAKLTIFEAMIRQYERWALSGSAVANWKERMGLGVASGMATAVLTNPLDVVNTRIKGAAVMDAERSLWSVGHEIAVREGAHTLFAGLQFRTVILGFGSGVFWGAHAACREMLGLSELSH
jgi:hypothetical protein